LDKIINMKNILLAATLLFSVSAFSQTDTSLLRSGKFSLRMNDWEFIIPIIANNPVYEDLFDSIKVKIRPLSNANYPSGLTIVTVDSVTNLELNALCYAVKNNYNKSTSSTVDRIVSAARLNSTFVRYRQDLWDADEENIFNNRRADGKTRLRKR